MKTFHVALLVIILIAFLIFVPLIPFSAMYGEGIGTGHYGSATSLLTLYGGVLSPAVGNTYVYKFRTGPMTAVVCTMEAMRCPDGSFVGRNASNNCEFDPCPSSNITTSQ